MAHSANLSLNVDGRYIDAEDARGSDFARVQGLTLWSNGEFDEAESITDIRSEDVKQEVKELLDFTEELADDHDLVLQVQSDNSGTRVSSAQRGTDTSSLRQKYSEYKS